MRRAKTEKSVSFTFPDVEDFDVVEYDRVIQKLTPKSMDRRGRYVFDDKTISAHRANYVICLQTYCCSGFVV